MFEAESGARYQVDDASPFATGDTVRIRGLVVPFYSFCFPEGLLRVDEISYCDASSCCGFYTAGTTGNINCDNGGDVNLADITRLIDAIYISHDALCCEGNSNIDGDAEVNINLADITMLIDHVYITKQGLATCE